MVEATSNCKHALMKKFRYNSVFTSYFSIPKFDRLLFYFFLQLLFISSIVTTDLQNNS